MVRSNESDSSSNLLLHDFSWFDPAYDSDFRFIRAESRYLATPLRDSRLILLLNIFIEHILPLDHLLEMICVQIDVHWPRVDTVTGLFGVLHHTLSGSDRVDSYERLCIWWPLFIRIRILVQILRII